MKKESFESIKEKFEKTHPNLIMDEERYIQTKTKNRREFHIINTETLCEFWCQYRSLYSYNYDIIRYNTENVKRLISKITDNEYELIGECNSYNSKINILHKKCGNTLVVRASHFFNDNTRCKICRDNSLKTTNEKFDKELRGYTTEIVRVSNYINYHSDIILKCLKCEKEYISKPVDIRRQFVDLGCIRCPNCSSNISYGEKVIDEYLLKNDLKDNLIYKKQYTHPECKYKVKLKIDFAIVNKNDINGLPEAVIEFDGPQHYDPNSKYAKLSNFNLIQARDTAKNNFCKKFSIPLLRIKTFNKNEIEKELSNFLKKYLK